MKICLLGDAGSIHVKRWGNHFASAGNEVHLITFKNITVENIQCHFVDAGEIKVGGGNWKVLLCFNKVKRIIKNIAPDVLHAFYATSYGVVGALSGFHPYIVTPLGTDILISPGESFFYRILLRYVFKKADWITSMAPHMTDVMLKLGVRKSKMDEMIFGTDTTIFNSANRKLPAGEFIITSTRNFEAVYNIPHILSAISIVKSKIPGLRLNVIGSGSLAEELKKLTIELNISDVVTFCGKLTQQDVAAVLKRSHVSVSVSLSDGSSLSLIESMACGALPVVTNIPANHQWIKEGVNGFFVEINDVEGLADVFLKVCKNYDHILRESGPYSERVISEKGSWQTNMMKVENKYLHLSKQIK